MNIEYVINERIYQYFSHIYNNPQLKPHQYNEYIDVCILHHNAYISL